MVEPYKPLYTVEETATVLMTNTDTVYSLIRKGSLRALKLGRIKIWSNSLKITQYSKGRDKHNDKSN